MIISENYISSTSVDIRPERFAHRICVRLSKKYGDTDDESIIDSLTRATAMLAYGITVSGLAVVDTRVIITDSVNRVTNMPMSVTDDGRVMRGFLINAAVRAAAGMSGDIPVEFISVIDPDPEFSTIENPSPDDVAGASRTKLYSDDNRYMDTDEYPLIAWDSATSESDDRGLMTYFSGADAMEKTARVIQTHYKNKVLLTPFTVTCDGTTDFSGCYTEYILDLTSVYDNVENNDNAYGKVPAGEYPILVVCGKPDADYTEYPESFDVIARMEILSSYDTEYSFYTAYLFTVCMTDDQEDIGKHLDTLYELSGQGDEYCKPLLADTIRFVWKDILPAKQLLKMLK